MQTKFFNICVVGYDELEGHAFSNTGHIEVNNPPCDCRIFHSHMHSAWIEFYNGPMLVELKTDGSRCTITTNNKGEQSKRSWSNYDTIKVSKHLRKLLGAHGSDSAELIMPTTEPPSWAQSKAQPGLSFVKSFFKR